MERCLAIAKHKGDMPDMDDHCHEFLMTCHCLLCPDDEPSLIAISFKFHRMKWESTIPYHIFWELSRPKPNIPAIHEYLDRYNPQNKKNNAYVRYSYERDGDVEGYRHVSLLFAAFSARKLDLFVHLLRCRQWFRRDGAPMVGCMLDIVPILNDKDKEWIQKTLQHQDVSRWASNVSVGKAIQHLPHDLFEAFYSIASSNTSLPSASFLFERLVILCKEMCPTLQGDEETNHEHDFYKMVQMIRSQPTMERSIAVSIIISTRKKPIYSDVFEKILERDFTFFGDSLHIQRKMGQCLPANLIKKIAGHGLLTDHMAKHAARNREFVLDVMQELCGKFKDPQAIAGHWAKDLAGVYRSSWNRLVHYEKEIDALRYFVRSGALVDNSGTDIDTLDMCIREAHEAIEEGCFWPKDHGSVLQKVIRRLLWEGADGSTLLVPVDSPKYQAYKGEPESTLLDHLLEDTHKYTTEVIIEHKMFKNRSSVPGNPAEIRRCILDIGNQAMEHDLTPLPYEVLDNIWEQYLRLNYDVDRHATVERIREKIWRHKECIPRSKHDEFLEDRLRVISGLTPNFSWTCLDKDADYALRGDYPNAQRKKRELDDDEDRYADDAWGAMDPPWEKSAWGMGFVQFEGFFRKKAKTDE